VTKALSEGVLYGRPFGGMAFLWKNYLSKFIRRIGYDAVGRSVAIKIDAGSNSILLINVYLPCYQSGPEYSAELGMCIRFINNLLASECYSGVIITGDFNFPCDLGNHEFAALNNVFAGYNIVHCDHQFVSLNRATYINEALGHSSTIYHFFISNRLHQFVCNADVLECVNNFSDHNPIYIMFDITFAKELVIKSDKKRRMFQMRWDRANISDYYELSRLYLSGLTRTITGSTVHLAVQTVITLSH
jgi:hypothetical protein